MKGIFLSLFVFIFLLSPQVGLAHDVVADLESISPTAAAITYLQLGFTHILPLGFDHILFIISLVLLSPNLKQLFLQSAAFTVGHCLTLGLATLGLVNISPTIVEPLIAITIVYVAAENIFSSKLKVSRILLIFAFGLLHGLGFASALAEIGLAKHNFILTLLMFNFGVEIGQITVIITSYFLLNYIQKKSEIEWAKLVMPVSVLIIGIGSFWVIDRIF